jgi:2-oxoisovalerate dehydrogenase E2 component (dihydrolipoyl transacylase)
MIKQHNLQNTDIQGTGKDGRVMKEDVQRHVSGIERSAAPRPPVSVEPLTNIQEKSEDQIIALSPIQHSMFQAMSRSLNIPHFLYSHSVDVTLLNSLRKKLMSSEIAPTFLPGFGFDNSQTSLTTLPFIVKALSHAFHEYPLLNSHLDVDTDPSKPKLIMKASHNFGIAVDTPQGLLVPVLRNVQDRSIIAIAAELQRLSAAARNGQLSPNDFGGATFTISNMGSIGGGVLNPVIVPPMVAILGIGRAETTPAFEKDHLGKERIVKKERTVLSWAGDHRVLDGATMAKCARMVETILHNIDCIVASLK